MLEIRVNKEPTGLFAGIYAGKEYKPGDTITDLSVGDEKKERDFRTIELDHAHIDHPIGRFLNHSCDPTAFVDRKLNLLRANKDIQIGDMITFDYSINESVIAAPFECRCGSTNCRNYISRDK